jgi:hypothetical protein
LPLSRWAIALLGALATAFLNFGSSALAAAGCGPSGYAYAGLTTAKGAAGIGATLTAVGQPLVQNGHVAAWVGFGGPTEGPGGSAEWIQVGLNSTPGSGNHLYYEIAHPGGKIDYQELVSDVPVGAAKRVAITEVAGSPGTWQVFVDGNPVTGPVYLPGSHGALTPMAVAENWDGGAAVCNRFAYRFAGVKLASGPSSGWHSIGDAHVLQDPGYRVVRETKADFSAVTRLAPPDMGPRTPAANEASSPASSAAPASAPGDGLGTN